MKAIRIDILKPKDSTWKEFASTLRDLQYSTAKALNHCMTRWYLWQVEKEDWKQSVGKYPTFTEMPSPEKRLYAEMRHLFPEVQTKSISEINRKAKQRWSTDTKDCFYRLNKALPTFKKTHPVLVSGQQYSITKENGEHLVSAGLRPKDFDGQKRFQFQLATQKIRGPQKAVLDKLFSWEYKKSSIQIGLNERKRKWYVVFVYEPEKKDHGLDPEKFVGIDLGIKFVFQAAVFGSKDRLYADGAEINSFRKKIKARRRQLSRGGPFSGRKGRGRKVMLEPVLKIGSKERRFRDTKYHQYTSQIIKFAKKHGAGTIQLENLDGLKSAKIGNFILNDWAISEFHQKLEYKAEHEGISVKYVNPQYTSQRCSECGHIERGNRPDQETFECLVCGFSENADRNAALNLATPGIEDIISRDVMEKKNADNIPQEDIAI